MNFLDLSEEQQSFVQDVYEKINYSEGLSRIQEELEIYEMAHDIEDGIVELGSGAIQL